MTALPKALETGKTPEELEMTDFGFDPDPILGLMPEDQLDRVLSQEMCDIDPEFLGFTQIYKNLASIIPKHWTVIDFGCAYAPQAMLFKEHRLYVGVDLMAGEKFKAENSIFYHMDTSDFIDQHAVEYDKSTTFAICSYVPPWGKRDSREAVREAFQNVFTYYPSGGPA